MADAAVNAVGENVPLLSICIPTYNRAHWLRATLRFSASQVREAGGLVELIVSDNASSDNTREVVEEVQRTIGPVRYHRNDTNIGPNPNMHKLTSELARGKYVWVLGDDDFLRAGAVQHVLDVLRTHQDLDVVHVNYFVFPTRGIQPDAVSSSMLDGLTHIGHEEHQDRLVSQLSSLVSGSVNVFTPIYSLVLLREHGSKAFLSSLGDIPYTTLKSVLGHSVYVAEHLLGKRAFHIGKPYVAASDDITWSRFRPGLYLIYMPALYDLYERKGVARAIINQHREKIAEHNYHCGFLPQMLFRKDIELRKQFRLTHYVKFLMHSPQGRRILRSESRSVAFSVKDRLYNRSQVFRAGIHIVRRLRRL